MFVLLINLQVISQERLDEETNTLYQTDANGNEIAYRFNEDGDLMSFTDSAGNTYSTVYDQDGKITEFRNPDGTRMMLSYDSRGLVSSVVNPDGSEITYSYDSDDKMVSLTWCLSYVVGLSGLYILIIKLDMSDSPSEYQKQFCMVKVKYQCWWLTSIEVQA